MGHCGSTILDLALAHSPEILSVAQLNDVLNTHDPFQSGGPGKQRDFWTTALSGFGESELASIKTAHSSFNGENNFFRLLRSQSYRQQQATECEKIIHAALDTSGDRVLVDSSKNISRCLALSTCDSIDLYALHIIRDVRGLVNSNNKRNAESHKRNRYLRPTAHWAVKNIAASCVLPRYCPKMLTLRYEDFVLDPEATVGRLEAFIGEDLSQTLAALKGEFEIDPEKSMGLGGNRVLHHRKKLRFRGGEIKRDGVYNSSLYWRVLGWPSIFWGYRR